MADAQKEYMEKLAKIAELLLKHDHNYARNIIMRYIDDFWDEGEMERAERYLEKIDYFSREDVKNA